MEHGKAMDDVWALDLSKYTVSVARGGGVTWGCTCVRKGQSGGAGAVCVWKGCMFECRCLAVQF